MPRSPEKIAGDGIPQQDQGYASLAYRDSFRIFGDVVTLPRSGIQAMKRPIRGGRFDVVGLYPYSSCRDWSGLAEDIAALRRAGAVAVNLVADPFFRDDAERAMRDWDVCREFKTHFLVDLTQDWRARRTRNTRYYASKGLQRQDTFVAPDPGSYTAGFWRLYCEMADRLSMQPLQRLAREIVEDHLKLRDMFLVVAKVGDELTGAMMTVQSGDTASLHLMAMSDRAAGFHTSYALFHTALAHLERTGFRQVNLGGSAGLVDDPGDGLFRFKKRWATSRQMAMFGGCILDPTAYEDLCLQAGILETAFFPRYRAPGSVHEWRPGPMRLEPGAAAVT